MKKLIAPLVLLALVAGGLALAWWAPWDTQTREREREREWLESYVAWLDAVSQDAFGRAQCLARFDRAVGEPPSERLREAARLARDGCDGAGPAEERSDSHWQDVAWRVRSNVVSTRFRDAGATEEPDLAAAVRGIAGQGTHVHCWPPDAWTPLVDEVTLLDRDEYWLLGFADPVRRRIHLAPDVCEPLGRFYRTSYAPYLNTESLELAQALVTLAHEAEHIRVPYATEAEVECYAIQGVRGLVRDRGRRAGYANELAGLAWEVAYPHDLPEYRTPDCRDGGPLDLNPESAVWP